MLNVSIVLSISYGHECRAARRHSWNAPEAHGEAPSEVDQSTVVNGAIARRSRLIYRGSLSTSLPCKALIRLSRCRSICAPSEWSRQGVAAVGAYLRVSGPSGPLTGVYSIHHLYNHQLSLCLYWLLQVQHSGNCSGCQLPRCCACRSRGYTVTLYCRYCTAQNGVSNGVYCRIFFC